MNSVKEQKIRLEQKKNRLLQEELKLKFKERKMRTRYLIEIGGLVTKANLDHLPTNTLYGALLSLSQALETNNKIQDSWTKTGKAKLDKEQQNKHAIIIKFEQEPATEIKKSIREHGLRWNKLRSEWYGYVENIESLETNIKSEKYTIEKIS